MTRSAPETLDWNSSLIALLVIGSILWLAHLFILDWILTQHGPKLAHQPGKI